VYGVPKFAVKGPLAEKGRSGNSTREGADKKGGGKGPGQHPKKSPEKEMLREQKQLQEYFRMHQG